jgi:hypothetical protein
VVKKEDGFEKLARLIQEEGEDVRNELKSLEQKMHEGFSRIDRRLDETVQFQLDEHAHGIKVLEDKALPR